DRAMWPPRFPPLTDVLRGKIRRSEPSPTPPRAPRSRLAGGWRRQGIRKVCLPFVPRCERKTRRYLPNLRDALSQILSGTGLFCAELVSRVREFTHDRAPSTEGEIRHRA